MKYYIIAGEASGDLHGSNLIKAIRQRDPAANIRCWGGDKMQMAGADLVMHYRDLAFMGFWEVIKNLNIILRNLKFCKKDILQFQPDALILIDYPGFNLRIAKWAKKRGLKVIYYISPQVWAWKENRVKWMKTCIDIMLVILPFEKKYYKEKWNWEVEYVGHPLLEAIENEKQRFEKGIDSSHATIALLPGSRKQEISRKLPVMLEVSRFFPNQKFVVAKAPAVQDSFYDNLMHSYENVSSVSGKTYHLLMQSAAAIVTSGTATLETALLGVPQVVCYKGSAISYQIAKRVIKVKYISLVNLIMEKTVVKELIQNELTVKNLKRELYELLTEENRTEKIKEDYALLRQKLEQKGRASENAARLIIDYLSKNRKDV